MSDAVFRLRVAYAKQGRLRHLGHLEMLRTIERCVRRAGLPFAVTQGFSPHMRIQFSAALPTGVSSTCECYDAFLTSLVDREAALAALVRSTPRDIAPFATCYVTREVPALESWLNRARWEAVVPGCAGAVVAIGDALSSLAQEGEFEYLRGDKPKRADLTQTLVSHRVTEVGDDALVTLETRSSPAGALRPSALLGAALGRAGRVGSVPLVTRTGQWHEDEDGSLLAPVPASLGWPS